jgi:predicted enzyme related to lactoylglutathione lyase
MHINPVVWFDIYTTDLLRAVRFYEAVFALKLTREPTDGSFEAFRFEGQMPGSGAMGSLMKHPMRGPSDQESIVYFQSPDCELTCASALAHAGKVLTSSPS